LILPSRTCSSVIAAGADWFGKLLPAAQYHIGFVTAIDGRVDRIVDNLAVAQYRAIGLLELAGAAGVGIGLAYIPLGGAAAAGLILLLTGAGHPPGHGARSAARTTSAI
jgi:hypothetical protein